MEGDRILLMPIAGVEEIHGYSFYGFIKRELSETNEILFLPEQEYYLLRKGIPKESLHTNEMSDSLKSIISSQTNSRYIIKIEVLNSQQGDMLGFYTPLELNRYNAHYHQDNEINSASLMFTVFDTQHTVTTNKFQVDTYISPFTINGEDGGESRVNVTTGFFAITKAFRKGTKKLKKGIIKNNN